MRFFYATTWSVTLLAPERPHPKRLLCASSFWPCAIAPRCPCFAAQSKLRISRRSRHTVATASSRPTSSAAISNSSAARNRCFSAPTISLAASALRAPAGGLAPATADA